MPDTSKQWCFAWPAAPKSVAGKERAALVKGSKWPQGATITISFLDGDQTLRDRVQRFAKEWTGAGLARLTLNFLNDTTPTDCRISFAYKGSWSTVGTTCRRVPADQPTMNFGWLATANDDEARRVVLHEFGHLLGLIHEHQNPGSVIHWNRDVVIRELSGPPNNWSLDQIEHNMFEPQDKKETNYTTVDAKSIMMYPIPETWTTDGFSAGLNAALSATDKQFIHQQYQ